MKAFWAAENWLRLRILSVALLVLLPAVAVAYSNVDNTRQEHHELVRHENLMTARLLAEQQATMVAATEQILRLLATSEAVVAGSAAECNAEMRRVMASLRVYANIGMADEEGLLRCSALPLGDEPVHVGDRDFFRIAMAENGFAQGGYQVGRLTGIASVNYAFPVRDAEGLPVGVVYAAFELRELHELAAETRPERESLFIFLDGFGNVIAAPPAAGLQEGAPLDADLLGEMVSDVEGQTRHELAGREMLVSYHVLEAGRDGTNRAFVLVATPAEVVEGAARAAFWRSALLLGAAALAGIAAALVVAERIIVQEQRQRIMDRSARIQALQEADRQHVVMVNEIGHDLSSPLAPIKLQLYLMRRTGDPLTARQVRALDVVERNLEYMERLIDDLRDVFRSEAADFVIKPQALDFSRQLEDARETFMEVARKKRVDLELEVEPNLLVKADPDRINQAVFNLLSNAIKFSPDEGTIKLRATQGDGTVRVEITDEGPGLTQEEIARLFKPFSRVGDASAARAEGSGLGLYISKSIIEGHGGQAGVTSEGRGRGATFWFTLPVGGPQRANGARRNGDARLAVA